MLSGASGQEKVKAGYKCSKCGQPKRSHVCTYQPGMPLASAAAQGKHGGKGGGGGGGGVGGEGGADDRVRVSWSKHEDETIRERVGRMGPRWALIASDLPGRTGHAVRNRWHRLQNLDANAGDDGDGRGDGMGDGDDYYDAYAQPAYGQYEPPYDQYEHPYYPYASYAPPAYCPPPPPQMGPAHPHDSTSLPAAGV